jgi:hypothetical protein
VQTRRWSCIAGTTESAFTIAPRQVVQVCRNGMVMSQSGLRAHLPQHPACRRRRHRVVRGDHPHAELITSRTRDAVAAYLDPDYIQRMLRELEADSAKPIATIKVVGQRLRFTDQKQTDLLALHPWR